MEELTHLAGVGRKTANVVLGNAFGKNVGIIVDTHVTRVANRLGLTDHASDAAKIEQDLMPLVPQKDWALWSHLLIHHGRAICTGPQPGVRALPAPAPLPRRAEVHCGEAGEGTKHSPYASESAVIPA